MPEHDIEHRILVAYASREPISFRIPLQTSPLQGCSTCVHSNGKNDCRMRSALESHLCTCKAFTEKHRKAFQLDFGAYWGLARVLLCPRTLETAGRHTRNILEEGASILSGQKLSYAPNPSLKEIRKHPEALLRMGRNFAACAHLLPTSCPLTTLHICACVKTTYVWDIL